MLAPASRRKRQQRGHGFARLHMRLRRIEEALTVTPGQSGFQRGDALGPDALEMRRHAGKAREFRQVARRRKHKAALLAGRGIGFAPQRERAEAQLRDERLGGLTLAIGRKHRPGKPACGGGERLCRFVDEPDLVTGARQRQCLPQAGNARADNQNVRHVVPLRLVAASLAQDRHWQRRKLAQPPI